MIHFKSVGKNRVQIWWSFYTSYFNKPFNGFHLLGWILFLFALILGKVLLSNFQICCCGVIHKNLFKIINAFNLFPTCGNIVLFFLILYITFFVFICFGKGAFFPQRLALYFICLYIISLSLFLFSVCVASWFYLFSYFSLIYKVEMFGSHYSGFIYSCL